MKLEGSITEENLREAFAIETQAMLRYILYAEKAKSYGQNDIADMFLLFAKNEQEHAKLWIKCLNDIKITEDNLKKALARETDEVNIYTEYAKMAKQEGFSDIADLFISISKIEKRHSEKCKAALENTTSYENKNTLCKSCGYTYNISEQLQICPVCQTPK